MDAGTSRLQLALDVDDLDAAVAFYRRLLGAEPAKQRPGYASFAVTQPPLKLVLVESPGKGGGLNHLGIEVADTAAVDDARRRVRSEGLTVRDEQGVRCCYARQDKFWVDEVPDDVAWEVYTVLGDVEVMREPDAACC